MKLYRGVRKMSGVHVVVIADGEASALDPRLDLRCHSPDGLEWSYTGSGPSQLALAICADALGDDARAVWLYMAFKFDHVAHFDKAGFEISEADVRAWAANQAVSA
jgi:hypothetical protein